MKLYIKPSCPWCVEAVDYLSQNGYDFDSIDVTSDPEAYAEMKEISGQSKAPTLLLENGALLPDFGVDELIPFLEEHGLV